MTATVTRLIPPLVRYVAPGGWEVRVVSYRQPGDSKRRVQYFAVRLDGSVVLETTGLHHVKRRLGRAFDLLEEVTP